MGIAYDQIKHLLSKEQRVAAEGAPRRALKPKEAPIEQTLPPPAGGFFRSDLDSIWRICQNKCMEAMNGILTCDVCEGPMVVKVEKNR